MDFLFGLSQGCRECYPTKTVLDFCMHNCLFTVLSYSTQIQKMFTLLHQKDIFPRDLYNFLKDSLECVFEVNTCSEYKKFEKRCSFIVQHLSSPVDAGLKGITVDFTTLC